MLGLYWQPLTAEEGDGSVISDQQRQDTQEGEEEEEQDRFAMVDDNLKT